MGIYSSGGANLGSRVKAVIPTDWTSTMESLRNTLSDVFAEVALGAAVLDGRYLEVSGRFSSFPSNIVSKIDNAKPYHFWGAAYLARKNSIRFGAPAAAAQAAWLSHLGYQISATTTGRDPARAFFESAFGTANNKIRLDLAYAANGAHFGAQSIINLSDRTFDVNQTLQSLLRKGEDLKPLKLDQALALVAQNSVYTWLRWKRIFAPEAAMKIAKKVAQKR